jgi:hypothetical protein
MSDVPRFLRNDEEVVRADAYDALARQLAAARRLIVELEGKWKGISVNDKVHGALWREEAERLSDEQIATRKRAEQAEARLAEVVALAEHNIPHYGYGDNEAACDMADRLSKIAALATARP